MPEYEIAHYNGTDTIAEFNEVVNRGRREQAAVVRAALSWFASLRRPLRARRPGAPGRAA